MQQICIECGSPTKPRRGKPRPGRGKYCSRACMYQSKKWKKAISIGQIGRECYWKGKTFSREHVQKIKVKLIGNKYALGYRHTKEALKKIGVASTGPKNSQWRGSNVGYSGLHTWVSKWLGKPKICEHCGKHGDRLHWANKSHRYLRDLNDWIRLCATCHSKYDRSHKTISGGISPNSK